MNAVKGLLEIRDEAVKNEVLLDEKCVSTAINDIYDGKFVVEEPEEIHTQKQKDAKKAETQQEENSTGDAETDA